MSHFRQLLLAGVGVLALHGVQACASETELNPQPLPPQSEAAGEPTRSPSPEDKSADDDPNAASGGGGPTAPAPLADGGTDGGDASDTGAD